MVDVGVIHEDLVKETNPYKRLNVNQQRIYKTDFEIVVVGSNFYVIAGFVGVDESVVMFVKTVVQVSIKVV